MRPVRFTHGTEYGRTSYVAGEEAVFPDDVAARLVTSGRAVYADGANASEAAPKADTAQPLPSTSETGAASTSAETPPEPAAERAVIHADNVSRPQRETRRNRRG